MNLSEAWKKVLLFGLFGAAGCLAGWIAGEPYLAIAQLVGKELGAAQGGTLISKAVPATDSPPPPREFQDRLSAAGAKTGDIQMSLIWYNSNDLDLHCIDPNGDEICWRPSQRRARSGGELDVDRNAGCRVVSPEPVENIYWPVGRAPKGRYRVYLNVYQQCAGAGTKVESTYKINVLHGGERKEFGGTITKSDTPDGGPMRLIYEFETEAKLDVFVPAEFDIGVGATLKVPVNVRRSFVPGRLEVKADNLPDGVTAEPLVIDGNKSEGTLILKASESADLGKKKIRVVAKNDTAEGEATADATVTGRFSLFMLLAIGVWTALLSVGLCLALLGGQNKYLGKTLFAPGRIPLVMVILGAVGAGFASGTLGQALAYIFTAIGAGKVGFLIGWVLLGGLLGLGVSFFIPNLDRKKASLAGLAGGFLGALAFLIMSLAADWVGRFFGAAILGFCIGLMVAVVEVAFRRAWLEVRFSEREVITVNLGPEPVKIGGEARLCTVWARGAAEVALKYWIRDGKVYCEDVPSKREAIVGDGDTRPAGNVTVVVRTGSSPAPAGAARPAPPAPPAPPALPVPVALPAPMALPAPPALPVAREVRSATPPRPAAPPAVTKPTSAPAAPPKPQAPSATDYDDGLPMPMSPPPPPRVSTTKSILDIDDLFAGNAPKPAGAAQPPKPPTPVAPAKPTAAAPPAPKPPTPVAPPAPKPVMPPKPPTAQPPKPVVPAKPQAAQAPKPPAPKPPGAAPVIAAKPGEDSCPTCGRKIKGDAGARYCMVCDKTF